MMLMFSGALCITNMTIIVIFDWCWLMMMIVIIIVNYCFEYFIDSVSNCKINTILTTNCPTTPFMTILTNITPVREWQPEFARWRPLAVSPGRASFLCHLQTSVHRVETELQIHVRLAMQSAAVQVLLSWGAAAAQWQWCHCVCFPLAHLPAPSSCDPAIHSLLHRWQTPRCDLSLWSPRAAAQCWHPWTCVSGSYGGQYSLKREHMHTSGKLWSVIIIAVNNASQS